MSNGDGKLREWIDYLHAAAAVPSAAPDYAEAQTAVREAKLRIQSLMRTANAQDRNEAARALGVNAAGIRAAGLAKGLGESLAGAGVQTIGMVSDLPSPVVDILSGLAAQAGGRVGLGLKGTNEEEYTAAAEANPWAAFQGEMAPVVGSSILGLLPNAVRGTANISRRVARYNPEPEFTLLPPSTKPPSVTPSARPVSTIPNTGLLAPAPANEGLLPRSVIPRAGKPGHPIWLGEGSPTRSPEVRAGEPLLPSKHDVAPPRIPPASAKILRRQSFAKLKATLALPETPQAVKQLILAEFQRRGIVVSP